MPPRPESWHTGSFTKNFKWGRKYPGLKRLYDAIRVGFDNQLIATPRDVFRQRLRDAKFRDFIPVNFFLYNRTENKNPLIVVDELAFKAITSDYDADFDKLAMFSLLLSDVGTWPTAKPDQNHPSEWARNYILDQSAIHEEWERIPLDANTIESYLTSNKRFVGQDARKLSTNLSFIFRKAKIADFDQTPPDRWWADAVFLALDRFFLDTLREVNLSTAEQVALGSNVLELSGGRTPVREEMASRVARLYVASHGLMRFSVADNERDSNNPAPLIAVLSGSPRVEKTIPSLVWKWLEERLFVSVYEPDDVPKELTKEEATAQVREALRVLSERGITSRLTGDQIIELSRSEE